MPGTFVFKPIEANLIHDTDLIGRMNPYCSFNLGDVTIKSQICKKGGKHPHWNDVITVPALANQSTAIVDLMDKDRLTKDDVIGSFTIDLQEIQSRGTVSHWYPLFYKNRPAGEILLESSFQGDVLGSQGMSADVGMSTGMGTASTTGLATDYATGTATGIATGVTTGMASASTGYVEERVLEQHTSAFQPQSKLFTEQVQVVTPQVFAKEVETVETVPVTRQIETTVPQKVLKEVQVTEAVPVIKEIETVEPVVVKKLVEDVEPRLVTKTIQVIENVPVTKEVEVVEMVTQIKQVETIEPQIVTKMVEVTEQVPVMQNVTVTEPVTVKKLVEFEQPVTTTKTIVKELQQPVIVNEQITTEIGPATLVREGIETYTSQTYTGQTYTGQTSTVIGSEQQRGLQAGSDEFLRQQEGFTTSQEGGLTNTLGKDRIRDPNLGTNERL